MAQNESVAAFQRSLEKRYGELAKALQATIDSFATEGIDARKKQNVSLHRAAQDLTDFLAPQDRPHWLAPLLQASFEFNQNPQANSREFLSRLVAQHHQIRPIVLSADLYPLLDFDALYVRFRDEGRIPELFDKLIDIVSQIIDGEQVDSLAALQALRRIVELLKCNRNGSFLAARQSISLARYLVRSSPSCSGIRSVGDSCDIRFR